jgi:hypothetical protein
LNRFPIRLALFTLVCMVVLALWAPFPLAAQDGTWGRPVNLSVSGVANAPQLVRGDEGALYTYWWDQYDGLTVVRVDTEELAAPRPVPISDISYDAQGNVIINPQTGATGRVSVQSGGTLSGNDSGRVNAFFRGTTAAPIVPLRQTSTSLGSQDWSEPRTIVPGVAEWRSVTGPDGSIHLLLMYPGRTEEQMPGVYYMRSDDGGTNWDSQVLVATSLYVRMATEDASNLDLAIAEGGRLYAAWTEPGTDRAFYTWSWDGGRSWVQPQLVDPDDPTATNAQIGLGTDGNVLLIWQGTAATGEPTLMMSHSVDWGWNWTMPERILTGLAVRGAKLSLHSLPEGGVLVVAGGQRNGPSLAVWRPAASDGPGVAGWSDVVDLRFPAHGPDTDAVASVTRWQVEVTEEDSLYLVGQDTERDVWLLRAQLTDDIWSYPDRILWSDQGGTSDGWLEPARLAQSGAAQPLKIVAGADGQMQAFWWHIYRGLTSAWFDGASWMRPQHVRAFVEDDPVEGQVPPEAELVGDHAGGVHAFWLEDRSAEDDDDNLALLHSSLTLGEHVWSEPTLVGQTMAWRAAVGGDGTLHLMTLVRAEEEDSSAAIYTSRKPNDEESWTEPALLYEMPDAGAAGDRFGLALAAEGDRVFAAWDQGEAGNIRWSRTDNAGENWSEPATIRAPEGDARWPVLAALFGDALLLYQASDGDQLALYQVYIDSFSNVTEYAEPVLTHVALAPDESADICLSALDRQTLLGVSGVSRKELVAALWDRGQLTDSGDSGWSALQDIDIALQDLAQGLQAEWTALQVALSGDRFTVVALGTEGELWALSREATRESWRGAGTPVWSHAERIGEIGVQDRAISLVSDAQGRVHAMWSAREAADAPGASLWYARYAAGRWTPPGAIIEPLDGVAENPSIAAIGERLHAVWSGATGGQIRYAATFSIDADTPGAWPEPAWLPVPSTGRDAMATHPQIRADLAGRLHVVYAMPINQQRGIYYTRSDDEGHSWTPAVAVFDAAAAGWAMVDRPALAVDHDGVLYVAWLRMALIGTPRPLALYLGVSADGGATWSAPKLVAEGNLSGVQFVVGAHGEPHLIWHQDEGGLITWHSYSQDSGLEWSLPARVRGFTSLTTQAAVVADGMGQVNLVGVMQGPDDRLQLLQTTWDSAAGEWSMKEGSTLPAGIGSVDAFRLALEPVLGQLDALLHAELVDETGQGQAGLLHMRREVQPLESRPEPVGDLMRATAPASVPEAQPTATPHPTARMDAPPPRDDIIELGFFSVSMLSIGGVLMAALMVAGLLIARVAKRR